MCTRHSLGTMREFHTKNFTVIADAIEDDDVDLSWDEDGSTAYIMRACNALVPQIAEKAIELAQTDLEHWRQDALEEARSITQEVDQ